MSFGTTKSQAITSANKARRMMAKPGLWRVDVWENLGWCWCLEHIPSKAALTVWSGASPGRFHAMLSLTTPRAGDMRWNGKHFESPQRAVDEVVKMATRTLEAEAAKFKWITRP